MDNQKPMYLLLAALILLRICNAQFDRDKVAQNTLKTRKLPGLNICGKSSSPFDVKIINGKPAELGAYPWMANIGYGRDESQTPSWLCAGSLITDQYIITAAHCLHPSVIQSSKNPRKVIAVRLGDLDLNPNVKDGANPMNFRVEKVTYHEQYDNKRKVNDVGLIKMKGKIQFTALMRPICLPPPEFHSNLFVGYAPIVAGWGKTSVKNVPVDTRLLEAEVTIKNTEECRQNITSTASLRNAVIDHKVICASSPGKDSCQGDSGGPLMLFRRLRNYDGNVFLMGIVAYGYSCALEGYPGVYTRVSEYMGWIIDNLEI